MTRFPAVIQQLENSFQIMRPVWDSFGELLIETNESPFARSGMVLELRGKNAPSGRARNLRRSERGW